MQEAPFYFNWEFWSAIFAFIAIVLSQLPPLKLLFKKGCLTIDKHGSLYVSHGIGSPNIQLFTILKNVGGSSINVHSMEIRITPKNDNTFTLKGRGYFMTPVEQHTTMLTPFEVAPGQSWSHNVQFHEIWKREEQKKYKILYSNIRDTINEKNRANPPSFGERHEADPVDLQKLNEFFEKNFKWHSGEYKAELLVIDKSNSILAQNTFNFTLFESDSDEQRAWLDEYKYGNAIHLPPSPKQVGTYIDI